MLIPPNLLSPAALRAVVQEYVTRDGTDDSSVERRIEAVMHQLAAGVVALHFDNETQTCNILLAGEKPNADDGDEKPCQRNVPTHVPKEGSLPV
jgi:uncharacterized protein YheU (UPF0270 family)